ncbi:hypothetical protein AWC11_07380 [Mycobacterium interjectum]|nr:hypothetical protein AWC11_07380 [Mycobacterium interjectum]
MRAASASQAAWLTATAAQADNTAAQARAAAAAYDTARAATVHPKLVAANRAQLAALAATNLIGQNTPAIMILEAQYAEMWAQDITAMAEYQASSKQASTLDPLIPAPQSTISVVLDALSAPLGSTPGDLLNAYTQAFLSSGPYETPIALLGLFSTLWAVTSPASPITQALNRITATATVPLPAPTAVSAAVIRASIGAAHGAGGLSVPREWWANPAATVPGRAPAATPLGSDESTAIALPAPIPTTGGTPPKQQRPQPEYGTQLRFVTRPPAGG